LESMTEMKWMQVLSRRGAELDFVRSWELPVRAISIARMGCLAYPDINRRNIADDIPLIVDHGQRCDAFAVQ
jgi:hypothetical protein